MQYNCISADCHIDITWLPHDLFTSCAPQALKDRMPYVEDTVEGLKWQTKSGANFGFAGGVGSSGSKYVLGKQARGDVIASTGLYDEAKNGIYRPADPNLRLKEMERDGVDAEIIYGLLGTASRMNDPEAATVVLQIYNDWLVDFCRTYPNRQIGLASIPYADVDAAVTETYRVAKLGLKGLEVSCSWDMKPLWHPDWEPFWKAVNDVGLPLHFHAFPPMQHLQGITGLTLRTAWFSGLCVFPLGLANLLTGLMGAAVFERYPNIKVVFGESGIGWIPFVLDRMDFEFEDQYRDLKLKMKPSEYWRRQCKATFQYDTVGMKLIDEIGVETLMWGCDYPHPDGVWPDSAKYIEQQFGNLSPDTRGKIICENAGRLYGLLG